MIKSTRIMKTVVSLTLAVLCLISVAVLAGCSQSAKEVTVPDLTGMTKEEAETAVTDLGLTLTVQRERYSDKTPAGSIDGMITKAGETVEAGSEVKVVGSLGEGRTVPSMGGLTEKEATNLLNKVDLNPVIVEEYSNDVEEGYVISYTDGGEIIAKGSDVTLTISKGPEN